LFRSGLWFSGWILNSPIKSDMLNFDLDAFITAMIENLYKKGRHHVFECNVIWVFDIWMDTLKKAVRC
jgi:hypothetical protein